MITKLTLTNFKKHEKLTIDFTAGLSALKGANEAGKSTVYHAIVYALFGARALPMSLAETVTYDKPEGSLRVELDFTFENVAYAITRSKSGAVLAGGGVTANGQSEVTKYVERLFGVNADAATKLMVASQNGLRGALESGEAVPLIEKLANIDLIDTLISKVQAQLPSGSTKGLVDAISQLDDLTEPTLSLEDLEPAVEFAKQAVKFDEAILDGLVASDTIDEGIQRTTIARVVAAEQTFNQLKADLASTVERIHTPIKPEVDVVEAKAGLERMREHLAQEKAWAIFTNLKTTADSVVDFDAGWELNEKSLQGCKDAVVSHKLKIATAKARLITESACGLCGKDLQDVPEVVYKNTVQQGLITQAEKHIESLTTDIDLYNSVRERLLRLQDCDRSARINYPVIQKYVTQDVSVYPIRLIWAGSPVESITVWPDYVAEIRRAEELQRTYDKAVAVQGELALRKTRLESQLSEVVVDNTAKFCAEELLMKKQILQQNIKAAQAIFNKASAQLVSATNALESAKQVYAVKLEAYTDAMASKSGLEASLKVTEKNNALIKKLRDVRPVVATRLWSIVLASVSTYFSQIRGEPSVVTRSDSTFKIGGKPVGGLSGSTLDALGLAIRMALGKTFLPSVDFMLLDEPAAGMDEERETAMLGLLAATGYTQVVVVTHSGLADAFASSIIQL